MKKRILSRLGQTARQSAQPIFSTIDTDLSDGLRDLENVMVGMFVSLAKAAHEQAQMVAHNANIDVDEAEADPKIKEFLDSMPELA